MSASVIERQFLGGSRVELFVVFNSKCCVTASKNLQYVQVISSVQWECSKSIFPAKRAFALSVNTAVFSVVVKK